MSETVEQTLNVYQGADKGYKLTLTLDGVAWSIAGATLVRVAVKRDLSDAAALFSVTILSSDAGNNWSGGIVVFWISAAQAKLLVGDGHWDLKFTLSGKRRCPVAGPVLLQRQVDD